MRLRLIVFIALIWTILVAGVVNAKLHVIRDVRLFDATPPGKKVRLRLTDLWTGRYQAEVERRLTRWFGLRGVAIKTDNTLNLWAFAETRPAQTVVVGRDGWLFHVEDTTFLNRTDDCVACDELAARIGRTQRALLTGGRLLLPVVTAAKTTTERGQVQERWRRFAGSPRSDRAVTQRFKDALRREQVIFVDGHQLVIELRRAEGRPVFEREARHWSSYPACLVFERAITVATTTLGVTLAPGDAPSCRTDMAGLQDAHDLGYVLNVWGIAAQPPRSEPPPPPPSRTDLRPLVIGTSFMWDFARLLRQSRFGTDARFYYYDDAIFDVATQVVSGKVDANDSAWRAWTLGRNLYLVDLYEGYLPGAGFGPFLDQLDAALAGTPYVPTPR